MAQSPGEGEQPVLELQQLAPLRKWTKGNGEDTHHTESQFDDVSEPRSENGFGIQAVGAQQIDKVCKSQVEVDVLHTQQDREENTTVEKSGLLPGENDGQDQESIHEAIVLEVNMINYEETR